MPLIPRLFMAARVRPCPEPLRDLLTRLAPLRRAKAVAPEDLHFTLRFFGDVDDDMAARLETATETAFANGERAAARDDADTTTERSDAVPDPFDVHLEGLRSFPREGRPKVLWVAPDVAAKQKLVRLADLVDRAADSVGLSDRDRKFVPHLTVARMRGAHGSNEGRGEQEVHRLLREHHATVFGSATVGHVHLIESTLTPQGPVYEDRLEVPLR